MNMTRIPQTQSNVNANKFGSMINIKTQVQKLDSLPYQEGKEVTDKK